MLYLLAIQAVSDGYVVAVPDVEGCFSAGDTIEQAFANAQQAIESHLTLVIDDGGEIPQPQPLEQHRQNPDYQEEGIFFGVVDVDLSHLMGKAEKINVTLPSRLIRHIDEFVAKNPSYKSRSGFLAKVAVDKILATN